MDMAVIMFYVYYVAMAGVVFGVVATSSQEGIWGCILLAFNLIFAWLFALTLYEPLAAFLTDMLAEGAFYWDVVCYMGILSVVLLMGREVTRSLSKTRVKFPDKIENAGKYGAAFVPAAVLLGVLAVGFQIAPLPKNLDKDANAAGKPSILGEANLFQPAADVAAYMSSTSLAPISFDFEPSNSYFNADGKWVELYANRRAYFGSDQAAQKGMFIPDK